MSDTHSSGGAGSENGSGAEPREGDSRSESWIDRLMTAVGLRPSAGDLRENLLAALDEAGDGTLSADERSMIRNILALRETRVEDVMVQRAEIAAVPSDVTLSDLMIAFRESGHSRMPVFRESLDDASGMIHIRDLMSLIAAEATVSASQVETRTEEAAGIYLTKVDLSRTLDESGLIRPVLFVPETMPATDLLARMKASRIQLALVIDEFGGVDGLVSLEDVVEAVVGDIEDEHDEVEDGAAILPAGAGAWIADGLVELDDVAEATGIDLVEADLPEDIETLGGLVFALIGRMPAIGEVIVSEKLPGHAFEIVAADSRRIKRVRILEIPAEGQGGVEPVAGYRKVGAA